MSVALEMVAVNAPMIVNWDVWPRLAPQVVGGGKAF